MAHTTRKQTTNMAKDNYVSPTALAKAASMRAEADVLAAKGAEAFASAAEWDHDGAFDEDCGLHCMYTRMGASYHTRATTMRLAADKVEAEA